MKLSTSGICIALMISTIVMLQILNFVHYIVVWNVADAFGYDAYVFGIRLVNFGGSFLVGLGLGATLFVLAQPYRVDDTKQGKIIYGIGSVVPGLLFSILLSYGYHWFISIGESASESALSFVNFLQFSIIRLNTVLLFAGVGVAIWLLSRTIGGTSKAKAKHESWSAADAQ